MYASSAQAATLSSLSLSLRKLGPAVRHRGADARADQAGVALEVGQQSRRQVYDAERCSAT